MVATPPCEAGTQPVGCIGIATHRGCAETPTDAALRSKGPPEVGVLPRAARISEDLPVNERLNPAPRVYFFDWVAVR